MQWLGIDIGGANLKSADGKGFADTSAFSLWREPRRLTHELRTLIAHAPACDHLAVTMTGELADCFQTKADGVRRILMSLEEAADGRHTRVYLNDGTLVTPQVARSRPSAAAAANWHALARFAARFTNRETALLIDIGSTTCDIIPLAGGAPIPSGLADTERLFTGELVYTGIERSPVCGVVDAVPFRGKLYPVAQEVFATTLDVYVILGEVRENTARGLTADGGPSTKAAARTRLARMICADSETFNHRDAVALAQAVADAQVKRIAAHIERVAERLPEPPAACVLSGHGDFLARRALEFVAFTPREISLSKRLGPRVSRCAPAHALAVLAREAPE